jgi:hypothetical protein
MMSVRPCSVAAVLCFLFATGHCFPATEQQLVGTWSAKRDFMTLKLAFGADHSLRWFVVSADDADRPPVTARWRLDQDHLFVRWQLRNDWVKIPIFSVTRDTLVLDYPGRTTYRRRKP